MTLRKAKCCICGEPCIGNMKIRARKNKDYIFCTFHFNYYLKTPIKEIRKKIKLNKYALNRNI